MAPPLRTPRSTWLAEGLRALADGGPDAVRVDVLAKRLGVTRGGFYHHFAGRPELLDALLEAWERAAVDDVVARVERDGGDGRAKLRRLFAEAAGSDELLRVDLAVRDWARRDEAVAGRLRRVDDARMGHLRRWFADWVDDPDEVEARCLLVASLWIGTHFLAAGHGPRRREDVLARALRGLLAEERPPGA